LKGGTFILPKFYYRTIIICLFVCFSAACWSNSPTLKQIATQEVTDDLGHRVAVVPKIERVVSLAPNITENIFAVGAGDKLVGVTDFCDFPAEAKKIRKVGDTMKPNLETIIALKPDIVFVSTASQLESFAGQLEKQNIAVFVTNPQNFEGVLKNLKQFGELFNTSEQAQKLTADLQKRVGEVEQKVSGRKPVNVFVQISREPLFTVGQTSFITDLVKRAGGRSVTDNIPESYPKISKETALASEPEVIILSDSPDNQAPSDIFQNSPAVKNGKVFNINADFLSRPGPRLVNGLEELAKAFADSK
jgi:iron complex transport system substrate-binding protein